MKKIALCFLLSIFIVSLTACKDKKDDLSSDETLIGESTQEKISNSIADNFDLNDEKIYWSGTIDDDFHPDKVVVIFKKTTEYPELTIADLKVPNLLSIEYSSIKPKNNHLTNFRQMAYLYLADEGKEKVLEVIKLLEELEYIQYVGPVLIYTVATN